LLRRIAAWLYNTDLLGDAWKSFCTGKLNWWWSEQLCLFAGTWTLFLWASAKRFGVKHTWAYMLIAQVIAIAVAANLFFLALVLSSDESMRTPSTPTINGKKAIKSKSKNTKRVKTVPPQVWISLLLLMLTVGISPYTSQSTFLPNVVVMHVLMFVPLLPWGDNAQDSAFALSERTLYTIFGLLSLLMRIRTSWDAGFILPFFHLKDLWRVLRSHPAQSSVSWDVVWTSISFLVWAGLSSRSNSKAKVVMFTGLTEVASIAVAAPSLLLAL
jgi:hypothetical protein